MADKIHLRLITTDGKSLEKMINYISIPTPTGPVGILAGHLPMLCAVANGTVHCRFGQNQDMHISVSSGTARVVDNETTLLLNGTFEIK